MCTSGFYWILSVCLSPSPSSFHETNTKHRTPSDPKRRPLPIHLCFYPPPVTLPIYPSRPYKALSNNQPQTGTTHHILDLLLRKRQPSVSLPGRRKPTNLLVRLSTMNVSSLRTTLSLVVIRSELSSPAFVQRLIYPLLSGHCSRNGEAQCC